MYDIGLHNPHILNTHVRSDAPHILNTPDLVGPPPQRISIKTDPPPL